MVVKVKLEGLKVYEARGLWYVNRRAVDQGLQGVSRGSEQ
jgi:hypothetical protein